MNATLQFDPSLYSEKALQLILAKAEEWKCQPSEAVARLLDQAAKKSKPKAAA
jgi:ribosomal protein S16